MTTQQTVPIAFSGNIPPNYDRYLGPLFFEPFALDLAARVRYLKPSSVLEVACGTGRVTRHLPEVLPAGASITATDLNPAMVEFAKDQLHLYPGIRWGVADAVSLPFADAEFDCLISQFGVMFYSDRRKAFSEASRTLKQGGIFLFNAWDQLRYNPAAHLADKALNTFFPVDTPAFYKVPFSYHDANEIREDLEATGFEIVTMQVLRLTGYSPSPEAAARGLLEGTPAYTAIVERDPGQLSVMKKTLAGDLEALFGSKDLNVPLQARLVMAAKK